jgi:hypothetical protein
MAGAPFERMDQLATCATQKIAREFLVRQKELAAAKAAAEQVIRSRQHSLPIEAVRAWLGAIRNGKVPAAFAPASEPPELPAYAAAVERFAAVEAELQPSLEGELEAARVALSESARTIVPPYLVFGGQSVRELLPKLLGSSPASRANLAPRKKSVRARERHILLYLQRLCAKNDTLSDFGPHGWGTADRQTSGLLLAPKPGVVKRESFFERWAAHGVAAALNADPEIRAELAPHLHPNGRFAGGQFVRTDSGESIPITTAEENLVEHCDGNTPAHVLNVNLNVLAGLAQRGVLVWEMQVPALEAHALDVLVSDVRAWRDGRVRTHWLSKLEPMAALPGAFAQARETPARIQIMEEARQKLAELGSASAASNRTLYAAINPIGEECFRDCGFSINAEMLDQVAIEAAPWIDLWRDSYAFVASRVAAGLRGMFEKAASGDSLPLPTFLRHCESLRLSLTGPGLVVFASLAFQEVKAAFREQFEDRLEADEWELSAEDCHFVRRNFEFEKFDEYTYPSADLQLSAKSLEAIARGEYQWVVAELHPPAALLQHGLYWSCPDQAALNHGLATTMKGRPSFHFGVSAADFTSTTATRLLDPVPDLTSFVATQRGDPRWRIIRPADTEVYVDAASGDVCLRLGGSREYLGSFTRNWIIPLGFHPFQFGRPGHLPRLRCGRVIVQRRTWTVSLEEVAAGDYTGVSPALVLAIEDLRAKRALPRYLYIRPTEQALRRSGAEGRDKDAKPVFIDLESYLFVEIFYRWLTKAGEVEVTEMQPAPDNLFWREADGRHTFELRTLITPRA